MAMSTKKRSGSTAESFCIILLYLQILTLENISKERKNMKATGIVRRVDDLGRIVIPKEIRRTLRIREGAHIQHLHPVTCSSVAWLILLNDLQANDRYIPNSTAASNFYGGGFYLCTTGVSR